MGEGEKVAGERYGAGKRQEISGANTEEEILEGRSRWRGEKEQAGEGEERSDGCGPARTRRVGGTKRWDHGEERDEDNDEAGDEGGFSWCRAGEASGLELIASCEEEADDQAREHRATADVAELAMVHDGQSDEGESHAEKIEKQR